MSEVKDFTKALADLEASIKQDTASQLDAKFTSFEEKYKGEIESSDTEVKKMIEGLKEQAEAQAKNLNTLSAKLNEKSSSEDPKTFSSVMRKALADHFDELKSVGGKKEVELKVVADMLTTGDHVTGDYPRDFNMNVVRIPGQAVNVADLVPSIQIEGGTYTYVRETGAEGAVAAQTEGADKSKLDADFSHIDVNTDFLAGIVVYSKKMRNNLPYLQSFLPEFLRRKYFIAENASFNTVLAAAATASTQIITGKNKAEMLANELSTLEGSNYATTNGIVMTPADWYSILQIEKSTGAGYGLPIGYTFDGGVLRVFGVPVFKANWLAANKYYVGDWSLVRKVVTEGLSLAFSEEEQFSKNNIVARIEAQVALAVERPESIVYGDFTAI